MARGFHWTAGIQNIPSSQGVPLDSLVLDAGVTALPCGAYLQQEDSDIVGVSGVAVSHSGKGTRS